MDKVKQIKVVGYCRVSTIIQQNEGHSFDVQKDIIKKYCEKKGYKLTKIYIEQISGTTDCMKRPEFQKAIKDLESGKSSGLVCTKFDRLSRNLRDLLNLIESHFKNKYNVYFTDFDQVDINTAEGRCQMQLLGTFSELERNIISKRTKQVMEYKKDKKEKTGGFLPYGYKVIIKDNNGKKTKQLIECEYEKNLIKELLDMKANEKISYRELGLILTERKFENRNGSLNWSRSCVMKLLHPEKNLKKKK